MTFTYPIDLSVFSHWTSASGSLTLVPVTEQFSFRVRPINRLEGMQWRAASRDDHEFGDLVLQHAVIEHPETFRGEPWEWDGIYAGLADQVLRRVLDLSGYGDGQSELGKRVQAYLDGEDARCDLVILTAFDGMDLEKLLTMTPELYYRSLGLAQQKLALLGLDPDAILDPEAFRKKQAKQVGRGGAMQYLPGAQQPTNAVGTQRTRQPNQRVVHERRPMMFTSD
jgi:hypothetical protein